MIEGDYVVINTLGELEKYKNRVLLFGYWDKDFPDFAWACKFISAVALFDENEHNPDTPIDKISVKAYHNVVEMYNGQVDMSFYPDMTHPLLEPRKVSYGTKESVFDGQLFIRTLTDKELLCYRKAMKRSI
jgi:hypothetical protein